MRTDKEGNAMDEKTGKIGSHPGYTMMAAGAGALVMYLLDPQQGRRRAARIRDKAVHFGARASYLAGAGMRDMTHRATGLVAELRGALHRKPPIDDVLVERVRAHLGRCISHPRAVKVEACEGRVTLSGIVLQDEHDRLLRKTASVRGVRQVEDRLETRQHADGVPLLQGAGHPTGPRSLLMQENWTASTQLLSAMGGVALATYGLGRRDVRGTLLAIVGAGLTVRALTNRPLDRLLGAPVGHRAVDERSLPDSEAAALTKDRAAAQAAGDRAASLH